MVISFRHWVTPGKRVDQWFNLTPEFLSPHLGQLFERGANRSSGFPRRIRARRAEVSRFGSSSAAAAAATAVSIREID